MRPWVTAALAAFVIVGSMAAAERSAAAEAQRKADEEAQRKADTRDDGAVAAENRSSGAYAVVSCG